MKLRVSVVRIINYDELYFTEDGEVVTDREAAESDALALTSGNWDILQFLQETENEGGELIVEVINEEVN